ncbi:MAG TPA: outer membrane protein transport protein [Vicinamibacterales bacterium]|nr:outer membrane protein transport protein [Vicinamibacterales bacterium]
MNRFRSIVVVACLTLLPASAMAQGASLHGFGPINSSMGGAGVALPEDSLNALGFNPALLTAAEGNQISFTAEFFKDDIQIHTTYGFLSGDAHPTSHLTIAPSFGWMVRDPRKKMALGFGLIAVAGFGTDYPQDNASILFAQPPNGFGRIYTGYQVTKIPVAFGFQVAPKLSLGASLNIYVGQFYVAPLPDGTFDTAANGDRWYPEAGKPSQSFAAAAQLGFVYQATPMVSVGGSVTTPQNYSPYTYNSTIADPSSRSYGIARTLSYDLDGPMVVSFGTGLKSPNKKMQIAIDGMFTKYKGVHGFGSDGGIVNGIIEPFGWRNVWTVKAGVQDQVSDKLTVRAGYNYSQMPLRGEVVISATGAPATFQHHITGGFGVKIFPFLTAEASAYYVPRQHVTGPYPDLNNNVLGTIDESNRLISGLIGLNFRF